MEPPADQILEDILSMLTEEEYIRFERRLIRAKKPETAFFIARERTQRFAPKPFSSL
jgi:hypothetical protein